MKRKKSDVNENKKRRENYDDEEMQGVSLDNDDDADGD